MIRYSNQKLNNLQIKTLASLHFQNIPNSFFSLMGKKYLEILYKYLNKSQSEIVFFGLVNEKIIAANILSLHPSSLFKRLFFKTNIIIYIFLYFYKLPISNILKSIFSKNLVNINSNQPEILFLFTDKKYQGNGYASKLIAISEKYLQKKNYLFINVSTLAGKNNKANLFYLKNKFSFVSEYILQGKRMSRYTKELKK